MRIRMATKFGGKGPIHHQALKFISSRQLIRALTMTLYHPVGTCAMGAVVDSRLRVRGVQNLRIADASVIPSLPSGNTHLPVILVGEMCAVMVLQEQKAPKQ
eukprot:GHVN01055012.1.p2 GENE.GHVN01055012.1~~GHVN01055012.1.p2  ORF type:complete len:102 (-),score=6.84 GHVN01055012.1:120-425(-)